MYAPEDYPEVMKQLVVIITGLSGSGKSVALRALEDEGFFCTDNLPVTLMESFVSTITANDRTAKIGIGIDIREKEFLPSLDAVLGALRQKYNIEIIFLEAEKDALLRRFKETRRPHPLASEAVGLDEAIQKENALLSPLRKEADKVIDTSSYTPHQLRYAIGSLFKAADHGGGMSITLISFGYKFGIPQNVDLLFDVRFIPNPHFVTALRALKGTDEAVQGFVLGNSSSAEFMERTSALLDFLVPHYMEEGKAYLTIGFGCTGGRHRSPAIVERMAQHIRQKIGIEPGIVHRDME